MTILHVDAVTTWRTTPAGDRLSIFENLSLEIPAGELVVLVGPSGCGKSTLLEHLAGFSVPSLGEIRADGQPIRAPSSDRGVIFQQDALLPWLDVLDNVAFGLQVQGIGQQRRRAMAREWIGEVGLAGYEYHRTWQLSGGMRQRAALARALAAGPRTLLMDEPFGALDVLAREQMQSLVLRLWAQHNRQIVLVTHDVDEAVLMASRLVLLGPRPAAIQVQLALPYGRAHVAGESLRSLRNQPAFLAVRERVLEGLFGVAEAS